MPRFSSIEEELQYWKEQANSLELELNESKAQFGEYRGESKEFEEELEKEIERYEKHCRELKARNESLKKESDQWKSKYQSAKRDSNEAILIMQKELDFLRKSQEIFRTKTRELEQDNDDLERFERVAKSSIQDLEARYNRAIERNVILENELEQKNELVVEVQRLKDELRDLNLELAVLRTRHNQASAHPTKERPSRLRQPDVEGSANAVTMVQEMLNRVKSLEDRLVSCRSLVTPLLSPPPSYTAVSLPFSPDNTHKVTSSTSAIKNSQLRLPRKLAESGAAQQTPSLSPLSKMRLARARSMQSSGVRHLSGISHPSSKGDAAL